MKMLTNSVLDDIAIRGKIPFLKKYKIINCPAYYATGTVTIATSSGVSTVTGLLTVWTADMKGRKFIVSGEDAGYKIASITSGTVLILEETYINPSDNTSTLSTATAYGIYKEEFIMPHDFASVDDKDIYDIVNGQYLDLEDPLVFDQEFPANAQTGSVPLSIILRGLTESSYYSTGTVAITKGANALTGTGTTWTSAMTGMTFRIDGDSEEYIFTYVSATTGTLDKNYNDTTRTLSTYKINPEGLRIVQVDPKLTEQTNIKVGYYKFLPKLVNDNDVCPLPTHNVILSGGIWKYAQYREKKDYNLTTVLKNNYEDDLAVLRKMGQQHYQDYGLKPKMS